MSDFTLGGYTGGARRIQVRDASKTKIYTLTGEDVAPALIDAGILFDGKNYPGGSLAFAIAGDLRDFVDSLELYPDQAIVEAVPDFNSTFESSKVCVSLSETRIERDGRHGARELRTFRVVRFRSVPDASAETASEEIGKLEKLVDASVNLQITQEIDRLFVVDSIGVDYIDPDQLTKNLIYCGVVEITFASSRVA